MFLDYYNLSEINLPLFLKPGSDGLRRTKTEKE
jgi:hypothetical protein